MEFEEESACVEQQVLSEPGNWKIEQVVNQAVTLIAIMLKFRLSPLPADVTEYIEILSENSSSDLAPVDAKKISKIILTEVDNCVDRTALVKALQCMDADDLVMSDTVLKLASKILDKKEKSWSAVVSLVSLFFLLAQRLLSQPSKCNRDALTTSLDQLKMAVTQHVAAWILKQGGWKKLKASKPYSMRSAIDYLLSHGEHFFFFLFEEGTAVGRLINEIVSGLTKTRTRPVVFLCGDSSFQTYLEEVHFYSTYSTAVFVLFLTSTAVKNKHLLSCYEAISSQNASHCTSLVPIELFGLKPKDIPSSLRRFTTVKVFPKASWKKSEVYDFVGILISQFQSLLEEELTANLAPRTEKQLDIKLALHLEAKLSVSEQDELIVDLKRQAKAMLEDPWTQLRQHLLHIYKVKNIHIVDAESSDYMILEVILEKPSKVERILTSYKNGQFLSMFKQHLKFPEVEHSFSWLVIIDEDRAVQLIATLQSTIADQQDTKLYAYGLDRFASGKKNISHFSGMTLEQLLRKAQVVGGLAKNIIESKNKYYPYDLYSLLFKTMDEIDLALVKNEKGFNIQHLIIQAGRPEYFEVTFYLNLWDKLRMQLTESVDDPLYVGYTPRGFAEKLLYKSPGPATLEEYSYFDDLWMGMPALHKACLKGCLTYVECISSRCRNINEPDKTGAVCILYACAQGSVSVVHFLLDQDADPMLENSRGENGLILASKFGKSHVVKLLLSKVKFDQEHADHDGNRALDYVALNGDLQTLSAFLDSGIKPDAKMVVVASRYAHYEILVQLATKHGVDCSGIDDRGRTPLLNAAANNDVNMLRFLCKRGEDVSGHDEEHRNCFHLVAEHNHQQAFEYLISVMRGSDSLQRLLDERDFYSERDQLKVVRGRDRGRKAWHYITMIRTLACLYEQKRSSGQIDVKTFGKIHASGLGQNPSKALIQEYEDKTMETLKRGLDDMTPLMLAAWKNQKEVALLLLKAGANPNIPDYFGSTPLHMAAMWGNLDLVIALEKYNVDLNKKNEEDKTALDVAEANEHQSVVNYIEGNKYFDEAKQIMECVGEAKMKLSDEELSELRSNGVDIRRYLINIVRDLKIDIYKSLLELNSGPVVEESCNTENLRPVDFKCEFAGNEIEFANVPR